jgi:hypothetical protein
MISSSTPDRITRRSRSASSVTCARDRESVRRRPGRGARRTRPARLLRVRPM